MMLCPTCEAANPHDSGYCSACGSSLGHPPVGPPKRRLGAFLIDTLVLLLAVLVVWLVSSLIPGFGWAKVYEVTPDPDPESEWEFTIRWPVLAIITLYHTIGVGVWATTLGKKALGLYIVRRNGSRIGIGRAFARAVTHWLSVLFFMLPFLMVLFRRDRRGLHDLICDTVVVRKDAGWVGPLPLER